MSFSPCVGGPMGARLQFLRAVLRIGQGMLNQQGQPPHLFAPRSIRSFSSLRQGGRSSELFGRSRSCGPSRGRPSSSSSSSSSATPSVFEDLSSVDKAGRIALFALCAGAAGTAIFYFTTVKDKETGKRSISSAIIR